MDKRLLRDKLAGLKKELESVSGSSTSGVLV
jgi:hypothetical protein